MVEIVVEIMGIIKEIGVKIVVKAVVKTGCHTTILYNGSPQCQSGGPKYTVLFSNYYLIHHAIFANFYGTTIPIPSSAP